MEKFSYYKKREQKRKELKGELPIDKQLEGSLGRTKWKFQTPLSTLRNSPSPSDQYFIEKLKQFANQSNISEEQLDLIKNAKEKEEQEFSNDLQVSIFFIKALKDRDIRIRLSVATSLSALVPADLELFLQLYEQALKDEDEEVRKGAAESLVALAPINPELFAQQYKLGLNDESGEVRRGYTQSLVALAPVNPELFIQLYRQGLNHADENVRWETAKSLRALAPINPELFSQLSEQGLNDDDKFVRRGITQSLDALAPINPDLFVKLYQRGLNEEDEVIRWVNTESLAAFAPINLELFVQLYKQGLDDESNFVRDRAATSLTALAPINPELFVQLYKQGLKHENVYVRLGTAGSLSTLASVDPESFVQLYEESLNDTNDYVRRRNAQSLAALAPVNPELFVQLYKQSLETGDEYVCRGTAQSLAALAPINPELFVQLCKQGLNSRNRSVRLGTGESLFALAPINPELYAQLYKQGLSDEDEAVRWVTAHSLPTLAPINSELFIKLYELGSRNKDSVVASSTVASLENYPFTNNALSQKINQIVADRTDETNNLFTLNILRQQVIDKEPEQAWQYLNVFNKVRDYLEEKNKDLDAIKQVASVRQFFSDNQYDLSNLAKIFSPKDFGTFLTTLSTDTLLYTQSFLEITKPIYSHPEARQTLKHYFANNSLRQDEVEKLLETGALFIQSNQLDQFISVIESGTKVQENLDKALLDIIAQDVGIASSALSSQSLERWNRPYLAYLGSNNRIIDERIEKEEENYENIKALYQKIVEHGFIGDFKQFILDTNSGDEIGKDLARHNQEVFRKFEDLEIDLDAWYNYQKTEDFLVSKEVSVDNTRHFQSILQRRVATVIDLISELQTELSPRQYQPLLHILQGAKTKGLAQIRNYSELSKQYRILQERIIKIQEVLPNREDYFATLFEHLGHLGEAVELFKKENLSATETKEQGFRVKLWERDPAQDLFQGNYTHCCIAVGVKDAPQEGGLYTHDPATIAHYLADAGIQVVEVYDQERKDPIANTWLFVSRDHNGEPVLVLDNIEVNNKYKDVVVNTAIRDNIFKFVTDFAKQCNIPKVGLGMVGTNDIDWDSLDKMVVAQVNKVGGYLKKYTSNAGDRAGRYYLEAYNAQTLGEVYNSERETKLESQAERREGIINVFDLESGKQESFVNTSANLVSLAQRRNISLEEIERDLSEIENKAFNPNIADSVEDILADLNTGEGVNFLFLENNKLVGYLKSLRADQFETLVDHVEYDANENTLYIESVAGKTNSYQALSELKELALEKGYQKLALHGISPRLNKILHRFGFETKAVIDDWAGEEAEYMELVLE